MRKWVSWTENYLNNHGARRNLVLWSSPEKANLPDRVSDNLHTEGHQTLTFGNWAGRWSGTTLPVGDDSVSSGSHLSIKLWRLGHIILIRGKLAPMSLTETVTPYATTDPLLQYSPGLLTVHPWTQAGQWMGHKMKVAIPQLERALVNSQVLNNSLNGFIFFTSCLVSFSCLFPHLHFALII